MRDWIYLGFFHMNLHQVPRIPLLFNQNCWQMFNMHHWFHTEFCGLMLTHKMCGCEPTEPLGM